MKKITVSILTTLLMLSMVFSSSVFAANEKVSAWDSFLGLFGVKATETSDVGVEYRGHVENKGDFPVDGTWIQGPERLGTVGEGLRLEAFWIKLAEDAPEGLHIKYQVHVQNKGWMGFVNDGAMAGTEGEGLRIEAIQISLVDDEGDIADGYSVEYRGHVQNIGDTEWYADGDQLGTTGSGLRLEALEIKIVQTKADMTAYEAALAAVEEADYTKASWAAYQAVVDANVVTEDNSQAEVDAATAIILDAQEDLVTKAVVTSATAATQNTITLQGAALEKLAVADITVKNITVSSVVASADGTSATVTLASDLLADTDTAVAVVSDGDTSNFTVKFSIKAQTLAVVGGLFDKNLTNQKVALTLDGVAITTDYLAANGYAVTFYAYTTANVADGTLFGATTSTDGAIVVPQLTDGTYLVQATAVKGSTILTSEKATIQVLDLVNEGSSIQSYKMLQGAGATLTQMNSTTLGLGEATTIQNVVVQYSATNTVDLGTSGYVLETSDKNVISVAGNVITANTPGTATITIRVGTLTKAITFTVTQNLRVPTTVTSAATQVNAIINAGAISTSNTVTVLDQFGDPVVDATPAVTLFTTTTPASYSLIKYALTGNVDGLTVGAIVQSTTEPEKGKYTFPLTSAGAPADGQISTVAFTNKAGANVGSFTVKAVGDNSPKASKVEYKGGSVNQSNTLNANMDGMGSINLVVNQYNNSNVIIGQVANIAGYTVLYDPDMVLVAGYDASDALVADVGSAGQFEAGALTNYIVITPVANAKGTSPIQVFTDNTLATRIDNRTLTVNAATPKITAVSFKTATSKIGTIDYKDVLTYTPRAGTLDPIITSSVTLSEATGYDVCLDLTDGFTIYLDRDRDGALTAGEKIGELRFTVPATATGISVGGLNVVTIAAGAQGSFTYTVWDTTPTTTAPVVVNSQTVLVSLV